jgi:hypothetical protein
MSALGADSAQLSRRCPLVSKLWASKIPPPDWSETAPRKLCERFGRYGSLPAALQVRRPRGVLSYVLVEVGGSPNHEGPNRKVNNECSDYFHIIAPLWFARSVAFKALAACQLGLVLIRLRWENEGSKLKVDGLPNPHTLFRHCPIVLHCVAVWFESRVAAMAGRFCHCSSSHCLRGVDCWVDGLVAAFTLANLQRTLKVWLNLCGHSSAQS